MASCMYIKLPCMFHEFGARPLSIVQAKGGGEKEKADRSKQVVHFLARIMLVQYF